MPCQMRLACRKILPMTKKAEINTLESKRRQIQFETKRRQIQFETDKRQIQIEINQRQKKVCN